MSADITLVFETLMRALHLATVEDYDVVGIGEVGHVDVGSNLSNLVYLGQGSSRLCH